MQRVSAVVSLAPIMALLAAALLLMPQSEGSSGRAWSIMARVPGTEITTVRSEEDTLYTYEDGSQRRILTTRSGPQKASMKWEE
jgi:hypothetical protein